MQRTARWLVLVLLAVLFALRRLNLARALKVDKQTQGPYNVLYREFIGTPLRTAWSVVEADLRHRGLAEHPHIAVLFRTERAEPKRFWLGVSVPNEALAEGKQPEEYKRDFLYKDVYCSCNAGCSGGLSVWLTALRMKRRVWKDAANAVALVWDPHAAVLRCIADPNLRGSE